jgi:hypothetical protein
VSSSQTCESDCIVESLLTFDHSLNADFLLANLVPTTRIISTERVVDTANQLLSTDAISGPSVRAGTVATAA